MTKMNDLLNGIEKRKAAAEAERVAREQALERVTEQVVGCADKLCATHAKLSLLADRIHGVIDPLYDAMEKNADVSLEDMEKHLHVINQTILGLLPLLATIDAFVSDEEADRHMEQITADEGPEEAPADNKSDESDETADVLSKLFGVTFKRAA